MYEMTAERDIQLDMYRGLVMIYILCVIHVAYWLGLAAEPWRSVILFEMPVIFFISGASVSVASARHDLKGTVWSRFRRVLLPYYSYVFYSFILIGTMGLIASAVKGGGFRAGVSPGMLGWALIPHDGVLNAPYAYHLWFVVPYLIVSCAFPFLRRAVDRLPRMAVVAILLSACVAVSFTASAILREVVIYNFFFVIGYLFYKKTRVRNIAVVFLVSVTVLAVCEMGRVRYWCRCSFTNFLPTSRLCCMAWRLCPA